MIYILAILRFPMILLTIHYKRFVSWTVSSVTFVDYLTNEAHMWSLDTIPLDTVLAANLFLIDTGSFKILVVIHKICDTV